MRYRILIELKKNLESPYNKIKRIVVVEIFPEILFWFHIKEAIPLMKITDVE